MGMNAKPTTRIEAPGKSGPSLHVLRDSNRLGIHIWENSELLTLPEYSLGLFSPPAAEIAQRMQGRSKLHCTPKLPRGKDPTDIPAISLSLLPNLQSGCSIKPYQSGDLDGRGFLVDLRQDLPHPARILRVAPGSLCSDTIDVKRLHVSDPAVAGGLPFTKFYHGMDDDAAHIAKAAGTNGPVHGAAQLNMLGDYYVWLRDNPLPWMHRSKMLELNEVIACASMEHVRAFVQVCCKYEMEPWKENVARLCGALTALQLHEAGLELPAVMYHANGREANELESLGRTKKELQDTAMKELRYMVSSHTLAGDSMMSDFMRDWYLETRESIREAATKYLDVSQELLDAALEPNYPMAMRHAALAADSPGRGR